MVCNQPPGSTQPGHPPVGRRSEYQRKLGRKQAHRALQYLCTYNNAIPVSVVSQCELVSG